VFSDLLGKLVIARPDHKFFTGPLSGEKLVWIAKSDISKPGRIASS
jgi:intein/homing endonuclease